MERLKTKDALILAGIQEIRQFGLQNFSIRRIAAECGVSCATPYKHYPNKDMFILAIFRYLGNEWHKIQSEIIERRLSIKETIVEISVAYVHFLVDNPDYRNIIFSHDYVGIIGQNVNVFGVYLVYSGENIVGAGVHSLTADYHFVNAEVAENVADSVAVGYRDEAVFL